jgi:predicted aspartyl protease
LIELSAQLVSELSAGHFERAADMVMELEASGKVDTALLGNLVLATRFHDCNQVYAISASPQSKDLCQDPQFQICEANALYWTCGIHAASPVFQAVCDRKIFPAEHEEQRRACALATLYRFIGIRQLWQVEGQESQIKFLENHALPIFPASVNNLSPEYFILDTGAATSVLSQAYCDRAGIVYLITHSYPAHDGAGREVTLYPTIVNQITIGGITVRNWIANVIRLSPNLKIGGIIQPLDTFRGITCELDMRERTFRVYPELKIEEWIEQLDEPYYSAQLIWDDGNVFVQGQVNGSIKGWFLFDTGAGANFVSPQLASKLGKVPESTSPTGGTTATGTVQVFSGFKGELAVGDAPPTESAFLMKDRFLETQEIAPLMSSGYIGIPWMNGRKILFSPSGREIYFTGVMAT